LGIEMLIRSNIKCNSGYFHVFLRYTYYIYQIELG